MRRFLGVTAAAALLAACGGDGSSPNNSPSASSSVPKNCTDLTSGSSFKVTLVDFAYQPVCVKASRSQELTVTNSGSVTHNFTIAGTPVSQDVVAGDSINLSPPGPAIATGTYVMYCKFHGHPDGTGMAGTIVVTS